MLPEIIEKNSSHSLYYYQCGESYPQIFFIHGLLGSARNWQTFLRAITHYKKINSCAMDLRGHGRSQHFLTENLQRSYYYQTIVSDCIQFIREVSQSPIHLVGHSLGGKIAISIAAQAPELVKKMMVVDIGLEPIPRDIPNALSWMESIPNPSSIDSAKEQLYKFTEDHRLCDFILTNLERTADDHLQWRVDLPGLQKLLLELHTLSLYEEWKKIQCPITLVRGARSEHLSEKHAEEMIASKNKNQVTPILMPKSGHWCHADEPQRFRAILEEFATC